MTDKHKTKESYRLELIDMVKKKQSLERRFDALHRFARGHLGEGVMTNFYHEYEAKLALERRLEDMQKRIEELENPPRDPDL